MKIYLISNNLLLDGISYDSNSDLENIRMIRPLSIKGESTAKDFSNSSGLGSVEKIYSSLYSGAVSASKYLASKLELSINFDERLNDCKVGALGSKNMKMVKGMQDHDFNYKLPGGESLNEVGDRLDNFVSELIRKNEESVIFTHKRVILGFLLKYSKIGYNLDDNLILQFNNKQVYDDSETEIDIYELTIKNNKIIDINRK